MRERPIYAIYTRVNRDGRSVYLRFCFLFFIFFFPFFVAVKGDIHDDGAGQGGVHLAQLPPGGRAVRAMPEAAEFQLRGAARLRRLPGQVPSRPGIHRDIFQVYGRDDVSGRETEAPGDRATRGHDRYRNDLQTEDRRVWFFRVSVVRRDPLPTGDRRLWSHVLQELRGPGEELSRVRAEDRHCERDERARAETRGAMVAARSGGEPGQARG